MPVCLSAGACVTVGLSACAWFILIVAWILSSDFQGEPSPSHYVYPPAPGLISKYKTSSAITMSAHVERYSPGSTQV